ncbi:MAG: Hpt domain-containing protein [Gammaproteobacteria bacterium]|nr:Hpt domain-containing protein [Gammaproteobacteria bacterium]
MSDRIRVNIDPDIEDLIPGFLNNRRHDVEQIGAALIAGDFAKIRLLGHSMKGAGGGYGFDPITDYGGVLEQAALREDVPRIERALADLADYLARVEPVFD